MTQAVEVPQGYKKNSRGHLVPESTIKAIDLARDELVREIVAGAEETNRAIAAYKGHTFEDIAAFMQLSAERYGISIGGDKGNVSLVSYDGTLKVVRAVEENISFDEGLQAAKALIDECIISWGENVHPNIRALVNDAFQVDQTGKISISRVLGLRRHDFKDEKWEQAMQAISDSIQVIGSKQYMRVYKRATPEGKWEPISLDVASV